MSEERLNKIEQKLDKVVEVCNNINVTLSAQHVTLEDHIRRTENLEKRMEPVEEHVKESKWSAGAKLKIIGFFASMAAIMGGVVAVLKYLGK